MGASKHPEVLAQGLFLYEIHISCLRKDLQQE